MPLYEYICDDTGEVIEALRPMADADKPLPDPQNKGRTFRRKHSTFQAPPSSRSSAPNGPPMGGCCACGDPNGPCR